MIAPDEISKSTDPILVVDDEKIFLSALLQTLQRNGYDVVACSSPLDALAEIRKRKFSVIISDQLMPEFLDDPLDAQQLGGGVVDDQDACHGLGVPCGFR